jgi:hypothetical protein
LAAGLGKVLDKLLLGRYLLSLRITNIITNLQELIKEVDAQTPELPFILGVSPNAKSRAYCEKFVMEMTEFLALGPEKWKEKLWRNLAS